MKTHSIDYENIIKDLVDKNVMFYDVHFGGIDEVRKYVEKSHFFESNENIEIYRIGKEITDFCLTSGCTETNGRKHFILLESNLGKFYLCNISSLGKFYLCNVSTLD